MLGGVRSVLSCSEAPRPCQEALGRRGDTLEVAPASRRGLAPEKRRRVTGQVSPHLTQAKSMTRFQTKFTSICRFWGAKPN